MSVKNTLSGSRQPSPGAGGIEQNIAKSRLKPSNNSSKENIKEFSRTGVNLFSANQRADARPENEPDARDEYWR